LTTPTAETDRSRQRPSPRICSDCRGPSVPRRRRNPYLGRLRGRQDHLALRQAPKRSVAAVRPQGSNADPHPRTLARSGAGVVQDAGRHSCGMSQSDHRRSRRPARSAVFAASAATTRPRGSPGCKGCGCASAPSLRPASRSQGARRSAVRRSVLMASRSARVRPCPPVVARSRKFQASAAEELALLPERAAVAGADGARSTSPARWPERRVPSSAYSAAA
jgi:hypothetical protein